LSTDYAVEAYGDGAAALAAIRRQPPDIVLTDVVMPGLDGHALVAAIRNDPALAPLPVVMLSARASRDDILSGLGHRADHYVPKPFVLAELKARLAGCLALAQVRSADAAWRRSIMSAFHDPVLIADPTGDVLEANTAFLRLVGRTASPQPGHQPWWSEPDERTQWTDAVATAMAQGSVAGEFLLRRRDRQTVRVAGRLSRVDVRGGPSRVLATLRDVTRERESQRRRAAAARIVADRGFAQSSTVSRSSSCVACHRRRRWVGRA
jgi:PAS domain S-box-containing protein